MAQSIAFDKTTGLRDFIDINGIIKLCRKYRIKELSLFGSVLRDDFDYSKSDVDVLVEYLPDSPIKGLFDIIEVKFAFEDLFGREVDLVEKRALKPYIKDEILRSRRIIYVKA
jgi:predicted nucleotidyltransferase